MIRKDFILRLIEEIAHMIAILLGLIKKGDLTQAQKLYSDGLQRVMNMDEDKLLQMTADQIRFIFENEYGESFQGLETLATLITRGGDIHLAGRKEDKAEQCYIKAMELFNIIEIESGTFSLDRKVQMGKISQLIHQIKSNPE